MARRANISAAKLPHVIPVATNPTLVVHTGGIGDLVLACPALAQLAAEGPLHLAGRSERLALVVAACIAQSAHDLEAIDFSSIFAMPSPRLMEFLRQYGRVIVWMRDDDHRIVNVLTRCGVAEARAFAGLPPKDWTRHASDYYLDCLGFAPAPEPFRMEIAPVDSHDVVIHPGSGGRRKNWPLEYFVELSALLTAGGREVTWSLGPAEEEFSLPPGPRLAALSLVELAGRLAGARLYIGNDSGITHIASAVGCPTLAIFGPTEPRVWAPRGEDVRVVRGEPWPSVAEVMRNTGTERE